MTILKVSKNKALHSLQTVYFLECIVKVKAYIYIYMYAYIFLNKTSTLVFCQISNLSFYLKA